MTAIKEVSNRLIQNLDDELEDEALKICKLTDILVKRIEAEGISDPGDIQSIRQNVLDGLERKKSTKKRRERTLA